jgi:hypothetical protein
LTAAGSPGPEWVAAPAPSRRRTCRPKQRLCRRCRLELSARLRIRPDRRGASHRRGRWIRRWSSCDLASKKVGNADGDFLGVLAILANTLLRRPSDPTSEPRKMTNSWATWARGCPRSMAPDPPRGRGLQSAPPCALHGKMDHSSRPFSIGLPRARLNSILPTFNLR